MAINEEHGMLELLRIDESRRERMQDCTWKYVTKTGGQLWVQNKRFNARRTYIEALRKGLNAVPLELADAKAPANSGRVCLKADHSNRDRVLSHPRGKQ
ncbi:hypothetical protein BGX20_007758 [Mortierella sp. AD010]|nr:hypothetical protein BGX20_007758 [Mortierella sp. AD010]